MYKASLTCLFILSQLNSRVDCQKQKYVSSTPNIIKDGLSSPLPSPMDDDSLTTIDEIITPSDKCKEIVSRFASGISNFTLCSVTNSRPIHLCQWCIPNYLQVVKTHNDFIMTIDDKGNPCREYFTNLDRIEIVTDAYLYVKRLWTKGKCDYCFQKQENGTIKPEVIPDVVTFSLYYEDVKSCFDHNLKTNITCQNCSQQYETLNGFYIDLGNKYGENVCLDVVDTMNTTRELWSDVFNCVPERTAELWLHVGMGLVGLTPFIFYFLAYVFATKQEAPVLQQRRLAEVFAVSHNSGATDMSDYLSSRPRFTRSSTSIASCTSAARASSVAENPTDPDPSLKKNFLDVPVI